MTSKYRDLTGSTLQSSLDASTGAEAPRSEPLAEQEPTHTFMQTTKPLSLNTRTTGEKDATTPPTTEKSRQHAVLAKVALTQLQKAGLIKRFKVLSTDLTTVRQIRIEFDMSLWTEDLELK